MRRDHQEDEYPDENIIFKIDFEDQRLEERGLD
jgi:hypothetical protein